MTEPATAAPRCDVTESARSRTELDLDTVAPATVTVHESRRRVTDAARAIGRFNPDGPIGYRAKSLPDGPIRATRAEAEQDEAGARHGA